MARSVLTVRLLLRINSLHGEPWDPSCPWILPSKVLGNIRCADEFSFEALSTAGEIFVVVRTEDVLAPSLQVIDPDRTLPPNV